MAAKENNEIFKKVSHTVCRVEKHQIVGEHNPCTTHRRERALYCSKRVATHLTIVHSIAQNRRGGLPVVLRAYLENVGVRHVQQQPQKSRLIYVYTNMSPSPVAVSPSRRRIMMHHVAPSVVVDIVEVSEDSSGEDHHDPIVNSSGSGSTSSTRKHPRNNNDRHSIVTNNKKPRRRSIPRWNRRTSVTDHPSTRSKMSRSASSDPGVTSLRNEGLCDTTTTTTTTTTTASGVGDPKDDTIITVAVAASNIARGGVSCPFPWKLHEMLDYCCRSNTTATTATTTNHDHGNNDDESFGGRIVTWNANGTAFAVLDAKPFVQTILPRYVSISCFHHELLHTFGITDEHFIPLLHVSLSPKILCTEQVRILSTTIELVRLFSCLCTIHH